MNLTRYSNDAIYFGTRVPQKDLRRALVFCMPAFAAILAVLVFSTMAYLNAKSALARTQQTVAVMAARQHTDSGITASLEAGTSILTTLTSQQQAAIAPLLQLKTVSNLLPLNVRLVTVTFNGKALALDGEIKDPTALLAARRILSDRSGIQHLTISNVAGGKTPGTPYTWHGVYQ